MPDLFNNAGSKISALYELVKTYNNSELLLKISDLQMDLAKLQSAYAELLIENTALKAENEKLKSGKKRGGTISVPVVRC